MGFVPPKPYRRIFDMGATIPKMQPIRTWEEREMFPEETQFEYKFSMDAYIESTPLDNQSAELLGLQEKLRQKEKELDEALKRQMVEPEKSEHRRLELED